MQALSESKRCAIRRKIYTAYSEGLTKYAAAKKFHVHERTVGRLAKDSASQIFLVVDNLRVHHAKCLEFWLKEHEKEVRLFYLPSYSPELNPDEYLNRDLKATMAEQARPADKKALRSRVESHLEARRKDRDAIKRLFQKPEVRYAAD